MAGNIYRFLDFTRNDQARGTRAVASHYSWVPTARRPPRLSAFLGWTSGRFLFVFAFHADLFQERLDRLFAAEEFFDRHRHVAPVALLVNFVAEFHSGLFVEITVL